MKKMRKSGIILCIIVGVLCGFVVSQGMQINRLKKEKEFIQRNIDGDFQRSLADVTSLLFATDIEVIGVEEYEKDREIAIALCKQFFLESSFKNDLVLFDLISTYEDIEYDTLTYDERNEIYDKAVQVQIHPDDSETAKEVMDFVNEITEK